jgi:aminoglycoside phosphotransferase (APT) family kinase protein
MVYIKGKPLMQPGMANEERRNAINTLVSLQCEVHTVQATGLPKQANRLTLRIKDTQHLSESLKANLLTLFSRLNNGSNNLCHGDLHPLNILYDGNKHWIIDWVDATAGNPLADACRTYLIFKQYMQRSSKNPTNKGDAQASVSRSETSDGIYLKSFCKETGSKSDDVLAWLPIVAASRLHEQLEDKTIAWLLGLIQEWDNTWP